MIKLSDEQRAIIEAPLEPMSVLACAGSGKTATAVHRLVEIRKRLGNHRGRVALLSFSNVAVETFRKNYRMLTQHMAKSVGRDRIEIDTMDGFITGNVLRPHAHRTMCASKAAFLVTGRKSFLGSFKIWPGKFPVCITNMQIGVRENSVNFYCTNNNQRIDLDSVEAMRVVDRLGKTGAYTHSLGRYWCLRVLKEQPVILRALARRYPHILIDESQDIGTFHQAILEHLVDGGSQVSLIGDPHQSIYEFAGADGSFLSEYAQQPDVNHYGLTCNYRSVPTILGIANKLSGRGDTADRPAPETSHGAFIVTYKKIEVEQIIDEFQEAVLAAGLSLERSAVLCRGRDFADRLGGTDSVVGQGLVKRFAQAAILRDKLGDYLEAFKSVAACIIGLLEQPPQSLLAMLTQPACFPEVKPLRRIIWGFTRNADTGLPMASQTADLEWHPKLLARVKSLMAEIQQKCDLKPVERLGNKLKKTGLPNAPLIQNVGPNHIQKARIKIATVHQVKGESLDAVLYLATKEHASALLAGINTEVGRIGYVAITRARNLLWLGVPVNSIEELRPALIDCGFQEQK